MAPPETPPRASSGHDRGRRTKGLGRVVRWDSEDDQGAVIVEGLPVEVHVPAVVVETPGARALQPGELVEIEYERVAGAGYCATRVCPTNG